MLTEWEINPLVCDLIDRARASITGSRRARCVAGLRFTPRSVRIRRAFGAAISGGGIDPGVCDEAEGRRCKALHWRGLRTPLRRTMAGHGPSHAGAA